MLFSTFLKKKSLNHLQILVFVHIFASEFYLLVKEIYNEKSLYLINYIRKHIQLIFYIVFMQAYYHVSACHVAMAAGKEY